MINKSNHNYRKKSVWPSHQKHQNKNITSIIIAFNGDKLKMPMVIYLIFWQLLICSLVESFVVTTLTSQGNRKYPFFVSTEASASSSPSPKKSLQELLLPIDNCKVDQMSGTDLGENLFKKFWSLLFFG